MEHSVPVSLKTWIAVIGATIGAFMAVLDIQIVNASLAQVQGAIGAGVDDGGWITTAYLVAEIVTIPLTGWLARVFSIRLYLLTNALLFLLFTIGCAFSQSLGQIIAMRALQGFCGGVLIPMAFTLIITLLPAAKRPIGLAMFAISATFAPAIGPTIGGYLTEHYGWQYIFYVNLIPGAILVGMLWWSLDRAPMQLKLLRQGDWLGIATMAVGLASLQTVLEDGNKYDWFGSPYISHLTLLAAVCLTLFVIVELNVRNPLLNLRLLGRRNFGLGTATNFLFGVALYGNVFILPLYLATIQGYNSEQIGLVVAWTALPQLVLIPLVPRLMKSVDARLLIAAGFSIFALSMFMNTHMTHDTGALQLLPPNLVRALGQVLMFAPLSAVATAGIEPHNVGSASSMFNMTRNLGGAMGIALLQTFQEKREQFHSNVLGQAVSLFAEATRARLAGMTQYFLGHGAADQADAAHKAIVAVGLEVRQQANILAFSDTFFLLGVALLIAAVVALLLRKPGHLEAGAAH